MKSDVIVQYSFNWQSLFSFFAMDLLSGKMHFKKSYFLSEKSKSNSLAGSTVQDEIHPSIQEISFWTLLLNFTTGSRTCNSML
jgi:hypothetical protein